MRRVILLCSIILTFICFVNLCAAGDSIPSEKSITLLVTVIGQGTTDPTPGTHIIEGNLIQCVAQAAEGWSFDRWSVYEYNIWNPVVDMDVYLNEVELNINIGKFGNHVCMDIYFVKNVDASNQSIPQNPNPLDGAQDVPLGTPIGWQYNLEPGYPDPLGFFLDVWADSLMSENHQNLFIPYSGDYYLVSDPHIQFHYGTTYYWRLHPIFEFFPDWAETDAEDSVEKEEKNPDFRENDGAGYPIFNFTTEFSNVVTLVIGEHTLFIDAEMPITVSEEPPVPDLPLTLPVDIQYYNEEVGFFITSNALKVLRVHISFAVSVLGNDVIGWIVRATSENPPWQGPFYRVIDDMLLETDEEAEPGREIYVYYVSLGYYDQPQPIQLSSFTANVTSNSFVRLQWITETENNLLGYDILRGNENSVIETMLVNNIMIPATNSSVTTEYIFDDESVLAGNLYYYWLQFTDLNLNSEFFGPIFILISEEEGEGPDVPQDPLVTKLIGAYPNPFNISTGILFELEARSKISVKIYNSRGQLIRSLVQDRVFNEGKHSVIWDGYDKSERECSTGIYYYRLETDQDYSGIKKMMLLK